MVRNDLLRFLKSDSEERGATILCMFTLTAVSKQSSHVLSDATHIFDGLNDFPTHIAHMRLGAFVMEPTPWPLEAAEHTGQTSQLYNVALRWLREDREHRRELEKAGRKLRGAKRDEKASQKMITVLTGS